MIVSDDGQVIACYHGPILTSFCHERMSKDTRVVSYLASCTYYQTVSAKQNRNYGKSIIVYFTLFSIMIPRALSTIL